MLVIQHVNDNSMAQKCPENGRLYELGPFLPASALSTTSPGRPLPMASTVACQLSTNYSGPKLCPPILLAHRGVDARALLHVSRKHAEDPKDVFENPLLEDGLKCGGLSVGAGLRQRRCWAADEYVRNVGLLGRLAGATDGDLRLSQVGVALLDALASAGDRLARLLLEAGVDGVYIGAREAEPMADGANESIDLTVDVRLLVARVVYREQKLAALHRPRGGLKVNELGRSLKTSPSPWNGTWTTTR
jgi:hypothetical protein